MAAEQEQREARMDERFERIDGRFQAMQDQLDAVVEGLKIVRQETAETRQDVKDIDRATSGGLRQMAQRFDAILDPLVTEQEAIRERLEALERRNPPAA